MGVDPPMSLAGAFRGVNPRKYPQMFAAGAAVALGEVNLPIQSPTFGGLTPPSNIPVYVTASFGQLLSLSACSVMDGGWGLEVGHQTECSMHLAWLEHTRRLHETPNTISSQ